MIVHKSVVAFPLRGNYNHGTEVRGEPSRFVLRVKLFYA